MPKSISDEYFVPYSTVIRIWKEDLNLADEDDPARDSDYWKHVWKQPVLDYIQLFLKKIEHPFISNDISEKD